MKRRWSVREGVFKTDDGLLWLKEKNRYHNKKNRTPMAIALKNGEISRVIDVKNGGLSSDKRRV
ncbi:MAG: hypothetical protein JSV09_12465 [Thermoplasmata archaeon]|nr:MAG: hypothetical protein JSV09_12465 [Thermoplasmata archaeon]